MVSSRPFVIWLLLSFIFTLTSAVQSPMDTSTQLSLHVYTRPNGQGQVQHIRAKQLQQDTSACFNLLSRHTGAIDMNDPHLRISFYRVRSASQ
ncbi:hypothetical protein DM01DRAFT_1334420 [Hesseltinella vesiculosa]|uniref:Uncharacterized protein n=1 Tax=Hesseltinella vesiculosa TaxID=101127 RepID=A0A1X2GLU0_9FUNG|nr:hypothetical protein DM01DRAFT_1334420 [Hesseltinella vesiculosa]